MATSLYNTDFYSWIQQQVMLIRTGNTEALDLDNILEELEGMGKSEHRALSSRLDILLMHLLKWRYQPEHQSTSWRGTIEEQRFRLKRLLKDNPGLKPEIPAIIIDAYKVAKITAFRETGLPKESFPADCPWTFDRIMDNDFWPGAD